MTKQEVIQQAWGETLFPILEMEMKRNGGNWYKEWKNSGQFYGNFLQEGLRVHLYREGIENLNGWFYPSELKGIENNNGWTKIESEADLPENGIWYKVVHKNRTIGKSKDTSGWTVNDKIGFEAFITHYKIFIEDLPPLY